jgi:uncharacterized membrane protein YkgB
MLRDKLERIDISIISFLRRISLPLARCALFLVFFWFGLLKVIGASPAGPMVLDLLNATMPFISPESFMVLFGLFEMVIGLTFLIPRLERLAIALLIPHMISTILPLILLPAMTWESSFVPTLEGQYIIKNILIIALAFGIASQLHPLKPKLT